MDRRRFNRLCGSLLAGASGLSLTAAKSASTSTDDATTPYPTTLLTDNKGRPMTVESLEIGSSHIFNYPFVTTPCFLLRLSPEKATPPGNPLPRLTDKNGVSYEWFGGVGEDQSVVAFSAICTHKMSHPAKPISHLNFRPEQKTFFSSDGIKSTESQLIYCCSEHSVYNPAKGAQVLSGPASQPLAAISLQLNDNGEILAVGSYGGNMYDIFLQQFGFRQALEQGVADPSTPAGATAIAIPADEYSQLQILC